MNKLTLKEIDVKNKLVLVRVDFNVPLKDKKITDTNRIKQALETINYLIVKEARIVLCSHLGKINHKDEEKCKIDKSENNMKYIVKSLEKLLTKEVKFVDEVVGKKVDLAISNLKAKEILLLQNTRYEKGESKNDLDLATKMAKNFDVFVMDAFGSAHRAHASTYGVAKVMNENNKKTCLGFLMQKEISALSKCVEAKTHPFIAVLGGSKVSDKIKVIEGLLLKADKIIIGGAMAYTFLSALGHNVGNSKVEVDQINFALNCLSKAKGKIILPLDHIVANKFENPDKLNISMDNEIINGYMGLDIGPRTIKYYIEELQGAKMVFWNGPMGVFENPLFEKGTLQIAKTIATLKDCFSVVGGGDSAAACRKFNLSEQFSHVSTGGGASLEMIENDGRLPGIDIISNK